MKHITALVFTFFTAGISAQILEDKTKILDKPQGDPLFEIEAGQQLYSFDGDDGWYKVRKEAWIKANDLIEEEYLSEGTELRNKEGDVLGVVLTEMKVTDKRFIKGFRGKDQYVVIVEGHVFRTKIKDGTIPEKKINEILAIKNRPKQTKAFEELFELYNFEKKEYEGFNVRVMRDPNKSVNEEKDFRVIVIFRGTAVYGVFCNDHEVTAPKIKATFEDGDFKGIYLSKPPAKQKVIIEEEMIYDFIAL